ncbi:carbohydrate ABC transporter permease [Alkaliphilus peptidifermentans]|uniref:Raffinose/stachyose/melibiose transport system permease protein n=1 Tax=Alkaliphilus peptidifermentans DSM 18978 TaxID=1120976 RepID=A0A1G5KSK4_9FIRM|nr:sugar ABC transporter permease [Alkaliphilus peptidifermentans]SCZ03151.1 raffinose/stachyose/melibiose transport system permease protein [Alkaliphilus peptidifermentans DSM 18978]
MGLYHNKKIAFLFIFPALLLMLVFIYYPIFQNFIYSMFRWSAFSSEKIFIGIDNYLRLFKDPVFYIALKNNLLYASFSIFFQVGLGLIIAAILEEKFLRKYQPFFRTVFFIPAIISITVAGLLWQLIYNPNIGIINEGLRAIGLDNLAHPWLADGKTAIFSVIVMSQWQYTGYIVLLFIVGIHKIPQELYESAMIDGANSIQKFWTITVPQVKEMIIVSVTITIIGGFKVFDEVYVMTGGGPGRSTEVLSSFMYRSGFRNDEMGYAAAIATIIFVITFLLTLLELKISHKKDEV